MEILQIKDLTFSYPEGERPALSAVDLTVQAGEFLVLCGESGCGKSTLLKLMKRELAPFGKKEGEILYSNTSIDALSGRQAAQEIGFVMQDVESQIVTDTVWHELAFGLESLGLDTPTIRRRVAEMACYFGIEDWFYRKCDTLSGGMKQLLNLASVMVMQPKVLLLDEPCAQLDPIAASEFISTLQKLNRELGLTVILAEHRLEEVFPIADRVLIMEEGRLVFSDSPERSADFFKAREEHPLSGGLPAAMRIFNALKGEGEAPLSVRQGRTFVQEKFLNDKDGIEVKVTAPAGETAMELKDVWFRYSQEQEDVLKGVTLKVRRGEHLCVLGGNGAGKTTALGVVSGLLKPYRGKVTLMGKKLKDRFADSMYIKGVALLPQDPKTLFVEKTLIEDLQGLCKQLGYKPEESKAKIEALCQSLEISGLCGKHPYDLSGGEQQKAALAKILLTEPQVLLLDEPTKGIDSGAKAMLAKIISSLKAQGAAVITVTHDVEFAAEQADRCAMIFCGEVVSEGSPTEFFSENNFYTTAANRISRGYYKNAVLCTQVVKLCLENGRRQ